MTKAFMACWLCIAMLFSISDARGQNFDYSFTSDTATYQNLVGATALTNGTDWSNSRLRVPIGFSFGFNGSSFDTLIIEGNGFVKLSDNNAIAVYYGSGCKQDSNSVYSLVSYQLSGTSGNKILKIQYVNTGYDIYNPGEYLNYQVWLYESDNKIKVHTGNTSYPGMIDSTGAFPIPLIGLIDPLQSDTVNGMLLSGDPASPAPLPFNAGGSLMYLDFIPPADRVYVFTPNGN